jgi:hypothetical protein
MALQPPANIGEDVLRPHGRRSDCPEVRADGAAIRLVCALPQPAADGSAMVRDGLALEVRRRTIGLWARHHPRAAQRPQEASLELQRLWAGRSTRIAKAGRNGLAHTADADIYSHRPATLGSRQQAPSSYSTASQIAAFAPNAARRLPKRLCAAVAFERGPRPAIHADRSRATAVHASLADARRLTNAQLLDPAQLRSTAAGA